jgi:DNA-binding XRE family transcriptional regulator
MTQVLRVEPVNELGNGMGFAGSAANVGELALHAGTASAVAREEAEIKAAIVLARQMPRNENVALQRIKSAMSRPSMAADARYSFPRGGQQVVGPSVYLAREAARNWGNLRYGVRIVSMDNETVHVKGYCHDIETNSFNESEDKFRAMVQRKNRQTGVAEWVKPDERDLRELVNKRGAICMRNAILQCLPSDVIEDAMQAAEQTIIAVEEGRLKDDPITVIRKMAEAFRTLSVTVEMLERYAGHSLSLCSAKEIANFKAIYKSIQDGQSTREDYFVFGDKPDSPANGQSKAESLASSTTPCRCKVRPRGLTCDATACLGCKRGTLGRPGGNVRPVHSQ